MGIQRQPHAPEVEGPDPRAPALESPRRSSQAAESVAMGQFDNEILSALAPTPLDAQDCRHLSTDRPRARRDQR
jgi:hypothetical protein